MNESEVLASEVLIVPDAEARAEIVGNIDIGNAVDARPCDCTACDSCRCTPCK